jgi:hypothetical protein
MFSSLRNRFGIPGLIAMVALVLAMAGGALAASGALTKQQKKEVEKIAKKSAGAPGSQGPVGPQGAAGANGTNGKDGANGANGKDGTNGKSVLTGAATVGECSNGGATVEVATEPATKKHICNGANGANGINGANATFEYLFNTALSGDPTSGKLGLDNATPGSAANVRISETDHESVGIAAAIATWISSPGAKGTLMVRKVASQSTYALYTITGNKDEGTYDDLEVAFVAGNGSFASNDPVTVQYFASAAAVAPKGTILKGTWSIPYYNAAAAGEAVPLAISSGVPIDSLSGFAAAVQKGTNLPGQTTTEREENESFCPGSATNPQPAAFEFISICIYVESDTNLAFALGVPELASSGGGAVALFTSNAAGVAKAYGSWVLTTS